MNQDEKSFKQKFDEIRSEMSEERLFSDINEDFYKYDLIKARIEKWKLIDESSYKNAYVSHHLPKLFSPLIRIDLIDWNPLEVK